MNKKLSSLLMAAVMSVTAVTPAFASEVHVGEAGGTGNSKVTFEVVNSGSPEDPNIFSAYVPAVLPIKMDLDGNITVPTNAAIRNGVENKAIQVEAAVVTTTGDWQHADAITAGNGAPDSHLLGLELNDQDLTEASFPWRIEAAGSLDLNMKAEVPQQTTVTSESEIATIGFTLNWAKDKEELNATNELNKAEMDKTLKNLTGKLTFTTTAYDGEGGVDISKNGDGSVIAVVDGQDATVYSDGGVWGVNTVNYVGMFEQYNAQEMDLRGLDTSKMTNMYAMFFRCQNLSFLDISSFDTSSVTNMGSMFQVCSSLSNLDLSCFDTNSVASMVNMFAGCVALATLNLSSFDTSSVTNMGCMFDHCSSLSTLDLSSFNTSAVTDMNSMFQYCTSLVTLDLSSFDTSSVTDMRDMFYNSNALTTCYGRTQADCDKFNSFTNKPSNVNFVVKPV